MLFVQKPKRENNIVALVNVQGMYKDNPNAGRMQSELFEFSSDLYDSIPIAGSDRIFMFTFRAHL